MTMHLHSKINLQYAIAVASCVMVGTVTGAEKPAKSLTAVDIVTRVVGNTIVYQGNAEDRVEEYLAADGAVHGRSGVHGTYESEWQIRFGHYLCLVNKDSMQSGCVQVALGPGNKITFRLDIGEVEGPFTLVSGNPDRL